MKRRKMRRTVILIGLVLVALIAACVIVAYFAFGANLRQIMVSDYVITARVGDRYEFSFDADRLIWDMHLPVPPADKLDRYPEILAIRSLDISVKQDGDGYHFETISTSTDPLFARQLRKAGIVLKATGGMLNPFHTRKLLRRQDAVPSRGVDDRAKCLPLLRRKLQSLDIAVK